MILRPAAASLDMSMALAALNAGSLRRKKNVHEKGQLRCKLRKGNVVHSTIDKSGYLMSAPAQKWPPDPFTTRTGCRRSGGEEVGGRCSGRKQDESV